MADKHPYSPGGAGAITATITQLRNSLPQTINAETLKKLAIASNNESYVINILRFLGVIDADGKRTETAASAFSKDDQEFQKEFSAMIEAAYKELFSLHHANTWELPENRLISFFRTADQTSALTGKRQAATFQTLASLAGHGAFPAPPKQRQQRETKQKNEKPKDNTSKGTTNDDSGKASTLGRLHQNVGLTVRIEVNLPPAGDQETYDKIFRSIRENLLNAK